MIKEWEKKIDINDDSDGGFDIEFNTIIPAIPLPLEGIASKLYQIAWVEGFDESRVEQRLETLTVAELDSDGLSFYDWVFFLPQKNELSKVLKAVLPQFMKAEDLNIFQAAALRAAIFTFKPLIKGAFERIRKGMLFTTVLQAMSEYEKVDIDSLMNAYIEALTYNGKPRSTSKRQFIIDEIETMKLENLEYANHPFRPEERLESFDPSWFALLEGEYGNGKNTTHHFMINEGKTYWQYLDWDPGLFHPAGDYLFVSDDGEMTIEFLTDNEGNVTKVLEQWEGRRNTIPEKL